MSAISVTSVDKKSKSIHILGPISKINLGYVNQCTRASDFLSVRILLINAALSSGDFQSAEYHVNKILSRSETVPESNMWYHKNSDLALAEYAKYLNLYSLDVSSTTEYDVIRAFNFGLMNDDIKLHDTDLYLKSSRRISYQGYIDLGYIKFYAKADGYSAKLTPVTFFDLQEYVKKVNFLSEPVAELMKINSAEYMSCLPYVTEQHYFDEMLKHERTFIASKNFLSTNLQQVTGLGYLLIPFESGSVAIYVRSKREVHINNILKSFKRVLG